MDNKNTNNGQKKSDEGKAVPGRRKAQKNNKANVKKDK